MHTGPQGDERRTSNDATTVADKNDEKGSESLEWIVPERTERDEKQLETDQNVTRRERNNAHAPNEEDGEEVE